MNKLAVLNGDQLKELKTKLLLNIGNGVSKLTSQGKPKLTRYKNNFELLHVK